MQAKITFTLTEAAQRAQMKATGQPVSRQQTTLVDVPPEDLDFYPVKADGTIEVNLSDPYYVSQSPSKEIIEWLTAYGGKDFDTTPHVPYLLRQLRAAKGSVAEFFRQSDEKLAALIEADPRYGNGSEEAVIRHALNTLKPVLDVPNALKPEYGTTLRDAIHENLLSQSYAAAAKFLRAHAAQMQTEQQQREQQKREEEDRKQRQEADKVSFIARWIEEHGDEIMKRQLQAGLLERKEAVTAIADHAFAARGIDLQRVEDIEYCDDTKCPCGENKLKTLPREVFERWLTFKIPSGVKVEFLQQTLCPGEDRAEEEIIHQQYVVDLTIAEGPFQFERRILICAA